MVECRTPEWEVGGSKPTAAVLCPWARHFTPRKYWLITQEAVAPSRHDWKIVDWDVKPQNKQTNFFYMYFVYISVCNIKREIRKFAQDFKWRGSSFNPGIQIFTMPSIKNYLFAVPLPTHFNPPTQNFFGTSGKKNFFFPHFHLKIGIFPLWSNARKT